MSKAVAASSYAPCSSQLLELPSPPSPETTKRLFSGFVADTVKTSRQARIEEREADKQQ